MTYPRLLPILLTTLLTLTACGGGSGGGGGAVPDGGTCSVQRQKEFVLDVARDWYLFPALLPAQVNLDDYDTAQELLDALTAEARAQGIDRFFSYVTTRQQDEAFFQEGEYGGFGFRSRIDDAAARVFFLEVFEGSPADAAGLVRGAELLAVDSGTGFVDVAEILADDPNLTDAFGPSDVGVERRFRFLKNGQTVEATLVKRVVTIPPIPGDGIPGEGVRILALPANPSVEVGYVNLRSFITTANTPLREAFSYLRGRGIDYFIFDLRYNGGGLLSVAGLVGDLFGANRSTSDVFYRLLFNPARSSNDETRLFRPQPESVSPVRIAFITTGGTASASEMTLNSLKPWLDPANVALIGENTYGKPVGQSAFDLAGCDTRLRLVTFRAANRDDESDYYNGLAESLLHACAADDDPGFAMGDPGEASTATALGWLGSATGACPAGSLAGPAGLQKTGRESSLRYPVPARPSAAQAWLPGVF